MSVVAVPRCFGARATIYPGHPGAGSIVGNDVAGYTITGSPGKDVIIGGGGPDTIDGLGDDDRVCALGGADVLLHSEGADRLDGGADVDVADYSLAASALQVSLVNGKAKVAGTNDVLVDVEDVTGTAHADIMRGDANANRLSGNGGDDRIFGDAGNDVLLGDGGVDVVSYFASSQGVTVDLQAGTGSGGDADGDTYDGIEDVIGTDDADILTGDDEPNAIHGRGGDDQLFGMGEADVIRPGPGTNYVDGGDGVDRAIAVSCIDTFDNVEVVREGVCGTPVPDDDEYQALGNVARIVAAPGLLDGDVDASPLQVAAATVAPARGGTLITLADGGFTYVSPAGFGGGRDSAQYDVTDGALTGTAWVKFDVQPANVWYVQNNYAGATEDGTSLHPFKLLSAAVDAAQAGDTILAYAGDFTAYGPVTLKDQQVLLGEAIPAPLVATLDGAPVTYFAASGGTLTPINTPALATDNTLRGFAVQGPVIGDDFGSLTISHTAVNAPGVPALLLSNGDIDGSFFQIISTNATTGVNLTDVTGTIDIQGGTITNPATAFLIDGGSVSLTYAGNATGATSYLVRVRNGHTGTVTFQTGSLGANTGEGLLFDNADGAYDFLGNLTLNGGNAALDIVNDSDGSIRVVPDSGKSATITNPTGPTFFISGGSAALEYSGNATQAHNLVRLVRVEGGHDGEVYFRGGTLQSSDGVGLSFDNADGEYDFDGTTTITGGSSGSGGESGIEMLNGSAGLVSVTPAPGKTASITNTYGHTVNVAGSTGTLEYGGTINQNITGWAMVNATGSPRLIFQSGLLHATGGNGIRFEDFDGQADFDGPMTLEGSKTNVKIFNNSSGQFSFSTGVLIRTNQDTAFIVRGSTANVTYSGYIQKFDADQLYLVAIVDESAGTITFDTNTLVEASDYSGTDSRGILLDNVGGTVNFNGTVYIGTDNDAQIKVANSNGANVTFGPSVQVHTATATPAFHSIDIDGNSNLDFEFAGVSTGMYSPLRVRNLTGTSNVTISGSVKLTESWGHMFVTGVGTGSAVNFTGTQRVEDGGTFSVLNIDGSVRFAGDSLVVANGEMIVNGGSGQIEITGNNNRLNSAAGTALTLRDLKIGPDSVRFRSISVGSGAGSTWAVEVANTGPGVFVVTGAGSPGSGGIISGGLSGIVLTNANAYIADVNFNLLVLHTGILTQSSGASYNLRAFRNTFAAGLDAAVAVRASSWSNCAYLAANDFGGSEIEFSESGSGVVSLAQPSLPAFTAQNSNFGTITGAGLLQFSGCPL